VHLPVSKTVVAARLGLKKETLSRLLQKFSSAGLIAVSHRDIAILNVGRLTEIAG
jgi:CRP-like cAMP-binding protein